MRKHYYIIPILLSSIGYISASDSTINVIAVGDIMLGSNYPSKDYLPNSNIILNLSSILRNADVTYGNLEGSFLTKNATTSKSGSNSYAFKMPDYYAPYLKNAGFDVVGIANNHVGDFGDAGRINTQKILTDNGISFAGLTNCPYATFVKNGVKYGFASFAPNNGTISINDTTNAKKIVAYLSNVSDIVIVAFHGGAEGSKYTHITKKNEIFLGENRGDPYHFSRAVINAGADLVFGSGPHVTRAVDLYKDRFICYSLGNFATSGKFSLMGMKGISPIVNVSINKKGEFQKAHVTSTKQIDKNGPIVDVDNLAFNQIMSLTKTDISPNILIFTKNNDIVKKIRIKK